MSERSALQMLAERMGIVESYFDIHGAEQITSDATRVALLRAMGIEAGSEAAAQMGLDRLDAEQRDQLLEPVAIVHAHIWQLPPLPVPTGTAWLAELVLEDGTTHAMHGVTGTTAAPTSPAPLPIGYHQLHMSVTRDGTTREASQLVIVPPARCMTVKRRLHGARAVGVLANLYSVRSAPNWGVGDVADLRQLCKWVARSGGSFVGVNPLHALRDSGWDVSPYSPVSRLYRNPIYLDVTSLPELADAPDARALIASEEFSAQRSALRSLTLVDYEGVMRLKRRVLEPLHRAFVEHHRDHDTPRGLAYARYRAAQGVSLDRFAVYSALADQMAGPGGHGAQTDWHDWPAALRDPQSAAVTDFARANRELVDFHRYLQFALDQQLARVGDGLALGVYQDLAVGSASRGCDTWAWPTLFARGAAAGAPPDDFAVDGQNWGLPPLLPNALRADHYHYWIQLLRAGFAHGGALRIDHVMGLFRLFWVPAGMSGRDGTYVRYPAKEMLAVAAVESWRADAVVIGENLGTVPPEVGPAMELWGLYGSAVVYFERDGNGDFLPARDYPAHALVSAGTHDHVPLAGFWAGRNRPALVARLVSEGLLPPRVEPGQSEFVNAVHAMLGKTPSALIGVALDDLALETKPVNVPGTTNDQHPNWQRKMGRPLENVMTHDAEKILASLTATTPAPA